MSKAAMPKCANSVIKPLVPEHRRGSKAVHRADPGLPRNCEILSSGIFRLEGIEFTVVVARLANTGADLRPTWRMHFRHLLVRFWDGSDDCGGELLPLTH